MPTEAFCGLRFLASGGLRFLAAGSLRFLAVGGLRLWSPQIRSRDNTRQLVLWAALRPAKFSYENAVKWTNLNMKANTSYYTAFYTAHLNELQGSRLSQNVLQRSPSAGDEQLDCVNCFIFCEHDSLWRSCSTFPYTKGFNCTGVVTCLAFDASKMTNC